MSSCLNHDRTHSGHGTAGTASEHKGRVSCTDGDAPVFIVIDGTAAAHVIVM